MAADHQLPAMSATKNGHGCSAKKAAGTVHDRLQQIGKSAGKNTK